jgi:hypothetical protein
LLENLLLSYNSLEWLPWEIGALLPRCAVELATNPLPFAVEMLRADNFDDVFASMTELEAIRRRATTICFALAARSLPALIVLEIVDAALPNSVVMKSKWDLIVAVKNRSMATSAARQ